MKYLKLWKVVTSQADDLFIHLASLSVAQIIMRSCSLSVTILSPELILILTILSPPTYFMDMSIMVVHGRLYLGTSSAFCFLIPERFISDTLPNGNVTGTWEGLVKICKVPEVVPCGFLSIYCQASAWTSPPGAPVLPPNSSVGETMCSCGCVFLPGWVQHANRKKLKEHLSHYASI